MFLRNLHPRLQDYIKDQKWSDMTPIQKSAFLPIFQGESCIIEAPTSGGKTEAVLFPLLTRLKKQNSGGFRVLYIAPLKALLNDLAIRVEPYAEMCSLEAFKWHGDVSQAEKVKQMLFPSDILLTTPESIEAILLRRPDWREAFGNLETIVVDEAHYFALTERGSHLISLLERLEKEIKKKQQRIAITATIGNPEDLLKWLMSGRPGGQCIRVEETKKKEKDFRIKFFPEDGPLLHDILYRLLSENKKSIVFERSRSNTEETAARINERNSRSRARVPVKVKTHHSSISKRLREEAEISIKQKSESSLNAIISTSTLELGIDIGELNQVVQIGGLNSSGSFLQRVGRTGRRDGKPQFFRGLCTDPEELLLLTGCVSLGLRKISERILFPKKAFHILAHQIICLSLQQLGVSKECAWSTLCKADCFSGINRDEFDSLINHMIQEDYLRLVEDNVLLIGQKTEDNFLRANWKRLFAIFDTGPMYNVVDGRKVIGTLDSGFARAQELPFIFILGGQEWNALKIDHELQQVSVEKNKTGIAPKWRAIGEYDVPFELAQEIGKLLMNNSEISYLDEFSSMEFQKARNEYNNIHWKPDTWIIDSSDDVLNIILWTFCGEKINRTLAMLLSIDLDQKVTYDYRRIELTQKGTIISTEQFKKVIEKYNNYSHLQITSTLVNKIKVKWFSKFSECLPDDLAKITILEKGFDLEKLKQLLQSRVI